jgi:tetratricopeptide (TPR) repeat protein
MLGQHLAAARRRWLFRLVAALGLPACFFLLLELGLWTTGYGVPGSFVLRRQVNGRKVILNNPSFTWKFFGQSLAKECPAFVLPDTKGAGTYRIFVLGSSAAMGDPAHEFGMARMLELLCQRRYPGVNFEVVNAASTASNSHVVLPTALACSRLEPDLIVVYMGNNEVTGPFGVGTVYTPFGSSPSLIQAALALKSTRTGQLANGLAVALLGPDRTKPREWKGMQAFQERHVRASDPRLEQVYRSFHSNLAGICRAARRAGAPVILSTVVVNLKDCAPFGSLHAPGRSALCLQKWEETCRQGSALQEHGRHAQAIWYFLRAEQTDADHADLHFRLAQCYWATGDFPKARERYVKARDLDTLRFRADTRINQIIRQVGERERERGVRLVDGAAIIEANTPNAVPGLEFLYDHCHLNFPGTYRLARAFLEQIDRIAPEWVKAHEREGTVLSEADCARLLAFTSWDRQRLLQEMLSRMQEPPFAGILNAGDLVSRVRREIQATKGYRAENGWKDILGQYRTAIKENSHRTLLCRYVLLLAQSEADAKEAERVCRMLMEQSPHAMDAYLALRDILLPQERFAEVMECCETALVYRPNEATILTDMGMVLLFQERFPEAIRYLEQAIRQNPYSKQAHHFLAVCLLRQKPGDPKAKTQAVEHLQQALETDPKFPDARLALARIYCNDALELCAGGRFPEARPLLERSLALYPDLPAAHYALARLLCAMSPTPPKEAFHHLSEALRIYPGFTEARSLLEQLQKSHPQQPNESPKQERGGSETGLRRK